VVADSTYGWQKEQQNSREGGTPALIKARRVSQEHVIEAKPGIRHSPAGGDPLTRGKVCDKPSHF